MPVSPVIRTVQAVLHCSLQGLISIQGLILKPLQGCGSSSAISGICLRVYHLPSPATRRAA
ncbi:hypothetical protein JZ751_008203 [Albula glossodonta]|nr:hypothetical protein JZ751_008203 [Albula glossodonta]